MRNFRELVRRTSQYWKATKPDGIYLALHKKSANPSNHVNPVKLTFGHRHEQLFLQDYRIRPDLHDGSDNHLDPCDRTFVQKPV